MTGHQNVQELLPKCFVVLILMLTNKTSQDSLNIPKRLLDSEMQEAAETISLEDPLTKVLISTPVVGLSCTH